MAPKTLHLNAATAMMLNLRRERSLSSKVCEALSAMTSGTGSMPWWLVVLLVVVALTNLVAVVGVAIAALLVCWLAPSYWERFWRPVSMPEGPREEGLYEEPRWPSKTTTYKSKGRCVVGEESHRFADDTSLLFGTPDGRQTWVNDAPEEEVAFNPADNPNSSDLLFRSRQLKKWVERGKEPPDLSREPATAIDAAHKGITFYQMLQSEDGHWAGDYGGPHFLLPGLIIVWYITSRDFLSPSQLMGIEHYLRVHQQSDGGWGTHIESPSTMFGTCLIYIALRLLGVPADDSVAVAGREFIQVHGGGTYAPSWAKFYMCILGVLDWGGHNSTPPEMFLLPYWLPFSPGRMWCHARMVYLPMSYLYGQRYVYPGASQDPTVLALRRELYGEDVQYEDVRWSETRKHCASTDSYSGVHRLMRFIIEALVYYERYGGALLQWLRARAYPFLREYMKAEDEQTNYIDIGPVSKVIHTLISFKDEGPDSQSYRRHVARIPDYLWEAEDGVKMNGYNGSSCWDTALAVQAIEETGLAEEFQDVMHGAWRYVESSQVLCTATSRNGPALQYESKENRAKYFRQQSEGGWGFGSSAQGWPTSDCTAEGMKAALKLMNMQVVGDSLSSGALPELGQARLRLACDYLLSMQNQDGGFATYESTRGYGWFEWLNPSESFGDIMIDYSYCECTSASIGALAAFHQRDGGYRTAEVQAAIKRGASFIKMIQRDDGSWYGSWGCCFTYGTWFGIEGLRRAGEPASSLHIQAASQFLLAHQNANGGWGEDFASCHNKSYSSRGMKLYGDGGSGVVPTSWALLALMAAECNDAASIQNGINYLMSKQLPDGDWPQEGIAGVFNRSVGIQYTAYRNIFPIWALGRYASTTGSDSKKDAK